LTGALDHALLALLVSPGFVVDADVEEPPARQSWEFHDRLFHRTTRSHNDRLTRGGTYRFLEQWPAPPAIRPHCQGQRIALPRPASMPTARSSSLFDVMENRRSRRDMSAQPVSIGDISLLLHRVARVKEVHSGTQSIPQETLLRPYPSAGAIHELEFNLAIRSCDQLSPGFYHYSGQERTLRLIINAETAAAGMVAECAASWGQPGQPPHAVMVITSRLPRLAWKYAGIAYWSVVESRAADRHQLALPHDGQPRMRRFDHLTPAFDTHRPKAFAKKSRSTTNCPIFDRQFGPVGADAGQTGCFHPIGYRAR